MNFDLYPRDSSASILARECLSNRPLNSSSFRFRGSRTKRTTTFKYEEFASQLKTKYLGNIVLHSPTLPSTSEYLFEFNQSETESCLMFRSNFASFPIGTLCICDEQSAGKGRGTNTWISPAGALALSFSCQAKVTASQIPTLQYIATLAIIKAIEDIVACDVTKDLGIRIKWPNDIYHEDTKLGGVLCKAIFHDGAFYVIVGIGLNLNNEEPTTCLNQILGITKEISENHNDNTHNFGEKHPRVPPRPKKLTRELLVPKILEQFEILHTQLEKSGFAGLKEQYLCYWMHTNTQLSVLDTKGKTVVTVIGITDNGLLLAVDDRGIQYELHPDGNSLDLLQGLIRKRISKDLPGTY